MKTSIVVPVKNPRQAKQRLSLVLSPEERYQLDLALIRQVMGVLAGFSNLATVLIVTDSGDVAAMARGHRFETLMEREARGQTEAVAAGTRWSVAGGCDRQITLPGDLPYVTADDIQALLDSPISVQGVIFCPATGDDGTNAIVTAPPDAIIWRFGERSFPDYVEQARRRGLCASILRLPNFVLDIDTPEDLKTFILDPRGHEAFGLLSSWNVPDRFGVEPART